MSVVEAEPVRGRYAPSPTGLLHVGNALAALVAWASVRRRGGAFVYRVEDLDPPRVVAGAEQQQMRDLRWLGLDWDEGPDVGGAFGPYRQSERSAFYEQALARLAESGRLFPCTVSRKELASLSSAPHPGEGLPPYPRALRPENLPARWYADHCARAATDAALRFRVSSRPVAFRDRVQGDLLHDVASETGDFVLKRKDGFYAYQLAVVVDDLAMGVTEVGRGADLLESTGRQIQLAEALGGEPPAYAHAPLLVQADGSKISKRDGGLSLASLRERGVAPEVVVGALAHAAGLAEPGESLAAGEFAERFSWDAIPPGPVHLGDTLLGSS
jgi:glutamyl-tRNA synthetase